VVKLVTFKKEMTSLNISKVMVTTKRNLYFHRTITRSQKYFTMAGKLKKMTHGPEALDQEERQLPKDHSHRKDRREKRTDRRQHS